MSERSEFRAVGMGYAMGIAFALVSAKPQVHAQNSSLYNFGQHMKAIKSPLSMFPPVPRYIARRVLWYMLTFIIAVILNFALPRLGGTNPVELLMAKASTNLDSKTAREKEEAYLVEFGLVETDTNRNIIRDTSGIPIRTSITKQLVDYLSLVLTGNFGTSIQKYPKSVSSIILEALPWTLVLQIPAILFGYILGNLLGLFAAYKQGFTDKVFYPLALFLSSIPPFCFGMLLVYGFGIYMEWFPALGAYDESLIPSLSWTFIGSAAYHWVLPFLSIFLIVMGSQAIGMRSMALYELGSDYVRYGKLLGLPEGRLLKYIFRNAMLPQLTGLALALGMMIGGAIITEMIFSYPGLGLNLLTAIQGGDYPVIQGCTLLITTCVLLANMGVDILIAIIDPRVRASISTENN